MEEGSLLEKRLATPTEVQAGIEQAESAYVKSEKGATIFKEGARGSVLLYRICRMTERQRRKDKGVTRCKIQGA